MKSNHVGLVCGGGWGGRPPPPPAAAVAEGARAATPPPPGRLGGGGNRGWGEHWDSLRKLTVLDAAHTEEVASQVDFVFCAVNMPKAEIKALEEAYARAECPVVSNNSAHRFTPDVPHGHSGDQPSHLEIIPAQRRRLRAPWLHRSEVQLFAAKLCSRPVPAVPLETQPGTGMHLPSHFGAGKTFATWPEMVDNVIPYIGGERGKNPNRNRAEDLGAI